MLSSVLRNLLDGETLTREEARRQFDCLLFEEVPEAQVAALLTLLQSRGPTPAEVAGFADSLTAAAVPFPVEPGDGVDTCGTGGDGKSTFNISTVAALVSAAAGATVFKHGNRAATSRSGSADLLEELGVPVDLSPADAVECARTHRFTFLFARSYHPVLAKVAPVRNTIGFPTVFNFLGPLLNPARVRRQVVGVYAEHLLPLMADTLVLRGAESALVVHGAGGLDEATPLGPFKAFVVRDGTVTEQIRDPADLGIPRCQLGDLTVNSPRESQQVATRVIGSAPGPARDAVLLNAALALEVAGQVEDWKEGIKVAAEAIDSGSVLRLVEALAAVVPGEPE